MAGETKSPEVYGVGEWGPYVKQHQSTCDGCGRELQPDENILVVEEYTAVCLPCIEWAIPQMED